MEFSSPYKRKSHKYSCEIILTLEVNAFQITLKTFIVVYSCICTLRGLRGYPYCGNRERGKCNDSARYTAS